MSGIKFAINPRRHLRYFVCVLIPYNEKYCRCWQRKYFQAAAEQDWVGSLPPTRAHTPSTRPHTPRTRPSTPSTRPQSPPHSPHSVQSVHDSIKPFQSEHMIGRGNSPHPSQLSRAQSSHSHSQPPTRPASPVSNSMPPSPQSNARTPPPKRWKRSFDLARNEDGDTEPQQHGHNGHLNPTQHGPEFGESVAKRFCEKRYSLETEREKRFHEADSNHSNHSQPDRLDRGVTKRFVEPGQSAHAQILTSTYPHSMPASPTMFDARYKIILIMVNWALYLALIQIILDESRVIQPLCWELSWSSSNGSCEPSKMHITVNL